eukprot:366400-Chlamydomonas_euryale.AAC.18
MNVWRLSIGLEEHRNAGGREVGLRGNLREFGAAHATLAVHVSPKYHLPPLQAHCGHTLQVWTPCALASASCWARRRRSSARLVTRPTLWSSMPETLGSGTLQGSASFSRCARFCSSFGRNLFPEVCASSRRRHLMCAHSHHTFGGMIFSFACLCSLPSSSHLQSSTYHVLALSSHVTLKDRRDDLPARPPPSCPGDTLQDPPSYVQKGTCLTYAMTIFIP